MKNIKREVIGSSAALIAGATAGAIRGSKMGLAMGGKKELLLPLFLVPL